MKKQTVLVLLLASITSNLAAMSAGMKLMRMVIGDYVKASQQKPQAPKDYDYELIVEQDIGLGYQKVQISEKCRNGQVAGKLVAINTFPVVNPMAPDETRFSERSYYGAVDSEELREKILAAGTCSAEDKVCSPAGLCICTNITTRIWRESLEKK